MSLYHPERPTQPLPGMPAGYVPEDDDEPRLWNPQRESIDEYMKRIGWKRKTKQAEVA